MFIISKLFIYFYSQLVFINFQLTGERLRPFASGCRFRLDSAAGRAGLPCCPAVLPDLYGGDFMNIGAKLKELRVLKGLTQEELADRAELSKGFISQVERDLTSPSIATLMDILQCLGTSIKTFFNEEPQEQIVFGQNDYFVKQDPELNNEIQWIIPNAQKNTMEPIRLTLKAGGSTYPDAPHEGEEFGYVLQGSISIHLGDHTYKAKKGESFYYVSGKTHYLSSRGGAVLIWVSSPPSF